MKFASRHVGKVKYRRKRTEHASKGERPLMACIAACIVDGGRLTTYVGMNPEIPEMVPAAAFSLSTCMRCQQSSVTFQDVFFLLLA